jgi:TolA-binding protein
MARLPLLTVAVALTGCVPYWTGTKYETDITALQGQVETLTETQAQQRKQNEQTAAELSKRIEDVEKRLSEAINQLQGGSADRGLEIDKMTQDLRELRGQLAEIQHKLEAGGGGEVTAGGAPVVAPAPPGAPPLPEDEAGLYRYGWEHKRDGNCDEAVRAFGAFATKFPGSKQADNALYLEAECLAAKGDRTGSIRALQTILKTYASGDKTDDALVLMHDNFIALGRCKDATPFLDSLITDYPSSPLVAQAKKKLAEDKKTCK